MLRLCAWRRNQNVKPEPIVEDSIKCESPKFVDDGTDSDSDDVFYMFKIK